MLVAAIGLQQQKMTSTTAAAGGTEEAATAQAQTAEVQDGAKETAKVASVPVVAALPADIERKKLRAEKFGVELSLTEQERRKLRAERLVP